MKNKIIEQLQRVDARLLQAAMNDPETYGYPFATVADYAQSFVDCGIAEEYINQIPGWLADIYTIED